MSTSDDKATPPAIHRIAPDNPPQFPCWLWCSKDSVWQHAAIQPEGRFAKSLANEYTHWSEERPTVTPDAPTPPAPTPTLPPEVREAIAQVFRDDRRDYLADPRQSDTLDMLCAALAPLWPRPAPVTADARALAFDIVARIGPRIVRTPDCGDRSVFHVAAEEVAAVLAPVVQRLKEAEAELRESPGHLLRRARDAEARAAAAEREAAKLRAKVTAAILDLHAAQAQARGAVEDTAAMDFLSLQSVAVRKPLRFGSKELFCVAPLDGDGEEQPSRLREAVRAARREGGAR